MTRRPRNHRQIRVFLDTVHIFCVVLQKTSPAPVADLIECLFLYLAHPFAGNAHYSCDYVESRASTAISGIFLDYVNDTRFGQVLYKLDYLGICHFRKHHALALRATLLAEPEPPGMINTTQVWARS